MINTASIYCIIKEEDEGSQEPSFLIYPDFNSECLDIVSNALATYLDSSLYIRGASGVLNNDVINIKVLDNLATIHENIIEAAAANLLATRIMYMLGNFNNVLNIKDINKQNETVAHVRTDIRNNLSYDLSMCSDVINPRIKFIRHSDEDDVVMIDIQSNINNLNNDDLIKYYEYSEILESEINDIYIPHIDKMKTLYDRNKNEMSDISKIISDNLNYGLSKILLN